MPRFRFLLDRIVCVATEDWAADELRVVITADERPVPALKTSIDDGEEWPLALAVPFDESLEIRLWDDDWPDPDDPLGSFVVAGQVAGRTSQQVSYKDARYEVVYSVIAADEVSDDLAALEDRFLANGSGFTVHREDSEVEPLIDGVAYFDALAEAIGQTTGQGDLIYITAWEFDPRWDIAGAGGPTLGAVLAEKAEAGVDVRAILNGALWLAAVPFTPWEVNLSAVEALRGWSRIPGLDQPLWGRVAWDWSGANRTGSQHQKTAVVRAGSELVAFVGGMDPLKSRRDTAPHENSTYPHHPSWSWGWHDACMRLRGAAAVDVWRNFSQRWVNVTQLPMAWYKRGVPPHRQEDPFNAFLLDEPPPIAEPSALHVPGISVQVLRSRFGWRIPAPAAIPIPGPGVEMVVKSVPWSPPERGALYEVRDTLAKAIDAAREYIYIEDQFLEDSMHLESIPDGFSLYPRIAQAIAANPDLKVIFVGSGLADPDDFQPGEKNRLLTGSVLKMLKLVPDVLRGNVAVWRVHGVTVHAKLMLVDDRFAAIGSANFQSRSMFGVDEELQVAVVTTGDLVRNLRVQLWAEHARLPEGGSPARAVLHDLPRALGLWRSGWLEREPELWSIAGHPPGFNPDRSALRFVGPADGGVTMGPVAVKGIEWDPEGRDVEREYVLLSAMEDGPVQIAGWTLSDRAGHVYTFPPGAVVRPGTGVKVWTGSGTDDDLNFHMDRGAAVWTNTGDKALLRSERGKLSSEFRYREGEGVGWGAGRSAREAPE